MCQGDFENKLAGFFLNLMLIAGILVMFVVIAAACVVLGLAFAQVLQNMPSSGVKSAGGRSTTRCTRFTFSTACTVFALSVRTY